MNWQLEPKSAFMAMLGKMLYIIVSIHFFLHTIYCSHLPFQTHSLLTGYSSGKINILQTLQAYVNFSQLTIVHVAYLYIKLKAAVKREKY